MTFDWGSLAKFPLSENSDKIRLTELAKNQTFPLFMTFLRLMFAFQQPDSPHYKAEHSGRVTLCCADEDFTIMGPSPG